MCPPPPLCHSTSLFSAFVLSTCCGTLTQSMSTAEAH
jgi:hypothetical protein